MATATPITSSSPFPTCPPSALRRRQHGRGRPASSPTLRSNAALGRLHPAAPDAFGLPPAVRLAVAPSPASRQAARGVPRQGSNEISRIGIYEVAGNVSVESTAAYIKQPNTTRGQLRRTLYDQYEVMAPLVCGWVGRRGRGQREQRRAGNPCSEAQRAIALPTPAAGVVPSDGSGRLPGGGAGGGLRR